MKNDPKYLLRFNGDYAVQIHDRGFSLVPDDEATTFDNLEAAKFAIRNLLFQSVTRGNHFEIAEEGGASVPASRRPSTLHHGPLVDETKLTKDVSAADLLMLAERFHANYVVIHRDGSLRFVWPETTQLFTSTADLHARLSELGNIRPTAENAKNAKPLTTNHLTTDSHALPL